MSNPFCSLPVPPAPPLWAAPRFPGRRTAPAAPRVGLEPRAEPSQLRGAGPALTGRARAGAGCPGSSSRAGPKGAPLARAAAAMARAALPGSESAPGRPGAARDRGGTLRTGAGRRQRPCAQEPAVQVPGSTPREPGQPHACSPRLARARAPQGSGGGRCTLATPASLARRRAPRLCGPRFVPCQETASQERGRLSQRH